MHDNDIFRVWAVGLYSGNDETGFQHNTTYAMMSICVELTDEGFANLDEVGEIRNVFFNHGMWLNFPLLHS